MRKILLSACAMALLSNLAVAGGDIVPVPVAGIDDTGFYAGAGLTYNRVYSTDSGWFDNSTLTQDQLLNITGLIGYTFNEYIGIEGRLATTIAQEDYSELTSYSIFLKPQYRFRDRDDLDNDDGYVTIYGLIGFGGVDVEGYDGKNPAHPDVIGQEILNDTSFQWGVGVSYTFVDQSDDERYRLKDTWSIFIDYTSLMNDGDIHSTLYGYDPKVYDKLSVDGLTVGVTYKF